jgi:hypothetical protein
VLYPVPRNESAAVYHHTTLQFTMNGHVDSNYLRVQGDSITLHGKPILLKGELAELSRLCDLEALGKAVAETRLSMQVLD